MLALKRQMSYLMGHITGKEGGNNNAKMQDETQVTFKNALKNQSAQSIFVATTPPCEYIYKAQAVFFNYILMYWQEI